MLEPGPNPGSVNQAPMALITLLCCPYLSGSVLFLTSLGFPPLFHGYFASLFNHSVHKHMLTPTLRTQSWQGGRHTQHPQDYLTGRNGQWLENWVLRQGKRAHLWLVLQKCYEEGVTELTMKGREDFSRYRGAKRSFPLPRGSKAKKGNAWQRPIWLKHTYLPA